MRRPHVPGHSLESDGARMAPLRLHSVAFIFPSMYDVLVCVLVCLGTEINRMPAHVHGMRMPDPVVHMLLL